MDDEQFNRMIRVRFVIPFKIVIGVMVALCVYNIFRVELSVEFLALIADVVVYSITACMFYMVGDYSCYQSLRIGRYILRKLTNKTEDPEC